MGRVFRNPWNLRGEKPMKTKPPRHRLLLALALIGMAIALLSFLESRVPWLADLCGLFGGGCRETAAFTLFGIPVALLGVGYYALMAGMLVLGRARPFRLVMIGAGVELTFLSALVTETVFCPFCILNFGVMAGLVAGVFRRQRAWEALALTLLFFVASCIPFAWENHTFVTRTTSSGGQTIVARVGGETITNRDLERSMASRIYDARMELYIQKREQLQRMVDHVLLQEEAEKQGLTPGELESRIRDEAEDVRPEEVDAFLAKNPGLQASWEGPEASLRTRIRAYLIEQKAHQRLRKALDDLGRKYEAEILLREPPPPLTRVSVGDSPTQGPKDAPVTVVEFSDYTCSACRKAHETTLALREAFQGKIRWVFKDLPLERHPRARRLAEAARCARDQGLFWEYQDLLFMAGGEPDDARLVAYALELGMEPEPFERCLKSGKYAPKVLEDIRNAEEAGVEVTPTFIINGRMRPGTPDPETFRKLIEAELAKAGRS